MASRIDPSWWQGEASLSDTIEAAMQLPIHRERWKYTRPQKVFDLIMPQPGQTTTLGNINVDTLMDTAPDSLFPLLQGHSVQQIEANADVIDLAEVVSPACIAVSAGKSIALHRNEVQDFGSFLWLDIEANAAAELSLNALTKKSHWDSLHIFLHRDARLTLNLHNLGATVARQDIQIHCLEAGADVTINAAASVTEGAHLDQQITLHHKAPNTSSRQQFNTAASAKSQITFNGRIHIYEQCAGVDAHLSNKNLALAESATINTKPELEIYTDDVACSHGATVGALDDAEVFYCTSRGIPPELAKRMLGLGFLMSASKGPLTEPARAAFESAII